MKKKVLVFILAVILVISIAPAAVFAAEGNLYIDSGNVYEGMTDAYGSGKPYVANNTANIVLPLTGDIGGQDIAASLNVGEGDDSPFVYNNYKIAVKQAENKINGSENTQKSYLIAFNNIPLKSSHYMGNYTVTLSVEYKDSKGEAVTQNFPLQVKVTSGTDPNPTPAPNPDDNTGGGDVGGGGGGASSQPKLIIGSYIITPDPAVAGESVNVSVTLKNTSKEQSVKNILISYAGETSDLMPENNTDNYYIEKIKAGGEETFNVTMKVRNGADPKPQKLVFNITYEDSSAAQLTSEQSVLIEIKQPIRTKYDEPTIPETLNIGDSASFSLNFYNLGKNTLYNVLVEVQGDGLTPDGTSYLGNMESGTNKQADIYASVDGIDGKEGECSGKYIVSYEDEYGEKYSEEIPFTTYISAPVYEEQPTEDMPVEEESQGVPFWVWIIVAAGAAVAVVVIVKKVKSKKANEILDDDDEDDDDFN